MRRCAIWIVGFALSLALLGYFSRDPLLFQFSWPVRVVISVINATLITIVDFANRLQRNR